MGMSPPKILVAPPPPIPLFHLVQILNILEILHLVEIIHLAQ